MPSSPTKTLGSSPDIYSQTCSPRSGRSCGKGLITTKRQLALQITRTENSNTTALYISLQMLILFVQYIHIPPLYAPWQRRTERISISRRRRRGRGSHCEGCWVRSSNGTIISGIKQGSRRSRAGEAFYSIIGLTLAVVVV